MPSNPTVARLNRAFTDLDLPFRASPASSRQPDVVIIAPVAFASDGAHRLAVRLEDIFEALPAPEPALPGPGQIPLPGV